jgi:hypothetical protein
VLFTQHFGFPSLLLAKAHRRGRWTASADIGAGNSGCDIAVGAIHHGASCDISMRRGLHFVPKYVIGNPAHTGGAIKLPMWLKRRVNRTILKWLSTTRRNTAFQNRTTRSARHTRSSSLSFCSSPATAMSVCVPMSMNLAAYLPLLRGILRPQSLLRNAECNIQNPNNIIIGRPGELDGRFSSED